MRSHALRGRSCAGRTLTCILVTVLALAVLAAAAGCRPPEEQPLVLTVPWRDGETSRLEVVNSETGTLVAEWRIEMAAAPDGGWVITSETWSPQGSELSAVRVASGTLLPQTIDYTLESPQMKATLTGRYGEKELVISATVNGEAQEATVRLPAPPYFDNEQFVATLRAFPLAEGWERAVNLIVSKSATKARLTVRVVGREEVTVPLGRFDCWKVELVGVGQTAWVNAEAPHQLVQYENSGAKTLSRLVEFEPGS